MVLTRRWLLYNSALALSRACHTSNAPRVPLLYSIYKWSFILYIQFCPPFVFYIQMIFYSLYTILPPFVFYIQMISTGDCTTIFMSIHFPLWIQPQNIRMGHWLVLVYIMGVIRWLMVSPDGSLVKYSQVTANFGWIFEKGLSIILNSNEKLFVNLIR